MFESISLFSPPVVEPVVEKKTVTLIPTISKTTPPIIANILFNSIVNRYCVFELMNLGLGVGLGTE